MVAALFLKPDDPVAIIVPSPLSLYCDASGKENDTPILAVAGFVGRTDEWLKFERGWNAVLEEFQVPYFHMREFTQSIGVYEKGWKGQESKRIAFIDGLVKALVPRAAYWIGACVGRDDYSKVDADYEFHEYAHPYTLCAKTCVEMTNTWRDRMWPTVSVEYVFECGDPHRGQLMDRVCEETGETPIFRNRDTVPLQAADFAAWELLKIHKQILVDVDNLFKKCRESFKRLSDIPNKWGHFREEDLRAWCRMEDIPKRRIF
jgi:hypothetical protein